MKNLLLVPALAMTMAAAALTTEAAAKSSCPLTNGTGPIKHVVYLQFDNTHFLRDKASVPSDLEQMPHLLSFLKSNGVLGTNNHTQIISHTANGILSSITGLYPDRLGSAIANSFGYFKPKSGNPYGAVGFASTFTYWTDPVDATNDPKPIMINELGKNVPAPWAAFTKAGCDFGAVALANMEFENVTSDITNVFGSGSPEAAEGKSNSSQAIADFEGIAIHCAQNSPLCASSAHAATDALPDEPGGYTGYQALFGHKYAVPAIAAGATSIPDLLGGTISGFPSFDGMAPKVTMAYMAQMLEAGVPVVFGYLSDAHDSHAGQGAFGPGEAPYVQQLQQYDAGFAAFFNRLTADGINTGNTLFVITVEEGDHFAGANGTPAGCDGVTTACSYVRDPAGCGSASKPCQSDTSIGEVAIDVGRMLATATGQTTPFFDAHYDVAPAVYLYGNPAPESAALRALEHTVSTLTFTDPYLKRTLPVATALADQAEMSLLHMVSADPLRTPSLTIFGADDLFISTTTSSPIPLCTAPVTSSVPACVSQSVAYAWIHGGIASQVAQTWLGMVGPGVLNLGQDGSTWTDHTDIRPTILALTGLTDSYQHDGRILAEHLNPSVLPAQIAANRSAYIALAAAYKQLTAPFGATAMASLAYATPIIANANTAAYASYEAQLNGFTTQRNALASQIRTFLEGVAFQGATFDVGAAASLTSQAQQLTSQMLSWANIPH